MGVNALKKDNLSHSITLLIKCIFIFGFIYDINFSFLPSLTTGRLCFLVLIIYSIFKKKGVPRIAKSFILLICFILAIVLIQYSYSSDSTQISRIIWFTLYGIVSPFLLVNLIKSKNEFLYLVSIVVFTQAGLSIFSFINPSIKSLFYDLIIYTSNFDENQSLRAVGFASIGGAALSVIQSIGVITILLLLRTNSFGFYKLLLLWTGIIVIIISIILIGRTGLFISFFCLFLYFVSEIKNIKNIVVFGLIIFILYQVDWLSILDKVTTNVSGFNIKIFTEWVENAFKVKDNDTTAALANMPIPPLTSETLLGTGMVVNSSGIGNASGHDSGYIQTYYSLGLLTALLFYISYFLFLIRQIPRKNIYLYILVFVMFTIEIKEPFIFQYIFPFFVLSMIVLVNKFEIKNLKNKIDY
ncbi:hypothetical protein [Elizabethkingia miricola]|uniref:hypothetical protein n=1 Tax=Elizabethkingia miricola TaxID=172045 RepID=UPI0005D8BC60|nr:hypothetical protein VO54_03339 [Elizabethkingia miricola]